MVAVIDRPNRSAANTAEGSMLELLLGASVDDLPLPVRRFHASTVDVAGTGNFVVEQAGSRIGRLVARAMRMPRATGVTPVTLSIRREVQAGRPAVEHWHRAFAGEVMASVQASDGRHVIERIGLLELHFVVTVEDERLRFRHVGTRLRIGPVRLRVPRRISPAIAASVGALGDDVVDVSVDIRAPFVGTLLRYAGPLTPNDRA